MRRCSLRREIEPASAGRNRARVQSAFAMAPGAAPKPSVSSLRREVKATMYATATSDADEARAKRIQDVMEARKAAPRWTRAAWRAY